MKIVKIESKLNLNEKEESEQNDKERKDTERPTDLIQNFNEVYERNIGEKVWSLLVKNYIKNPLPNLLIKLEKSWSSTKFDINLNNFLFE